MEINGKTFVVTGGGNGIGRQVVLELLRRGALVAALDLREDGLEGTRGLAGGDRLATFPLDVSDRGATAASLDLVVGELGPVDGLVNVAGIIQPFVRIRDLDWETIDRVVNVNFYGTLNMIKAYLPHLMERPAGHIANVSSMGGFLPVPGSEHLRGLQGGREALERRPLRRTSRHQRRRVGHHARWCEHRDHRQLRSRGARRCRIRRGLSASGHLA